ncbi:RICIN domain-containing protein [Paractinoplanes rishiriensis]|uniref:Ricin B lectin domain-containing protein n=1 Tax=Paractinoplanes rishiriensis TaxID=1050105 RepID=A0A919N0T1_9ACTN|nr:RICIN domain-containing protein [Actinoplanes rishiriensis]GIF00026.1 hypothetical protein Ari01nite_74900 [Actinoplanes rishiriensis]
MEPARFGRRVAPVVVAAVATPAAITVAVTTSRAATIDRAAQQWRFVDAGSGYYQIRSAHSGKVLELPDATDGTQLVQNAPVSGNTHPAADIPAMLRTHAGPQASIGL